MSVTKILEIARGELGVHEVPPYSNRVKYSDWYGMVGPWCDMFVSWVADQAGEAAAVGKFAYTPSHEAWFRSRGREVPMRDAQPGDILFFNFIGRTSHVGIVEANRGDGLITLEGNTNGSGSRDGGAVIRHFRSWSSGIVSVHRPAYSDSEEIDMAAADDIIAEIKAQSFKAAILALQVEKREIDRDKRKWSKLFQILKLDAKADAEDTARLKEIEAEIDALQAKIDAL